MEKGDLSFFILKNTNGIAKQNEMCSILKKKAEYKWKSPEKYFMLVVLAPA